MKIARLAGLSLSILISGMVTGRPLVTPSDSVGPVARFNPAMTFDRVRSRVVLFGGMEFSGRVLSDTWEWDGATWKKASEVGPPARNGHAMTFDRHRKKVILFGGGGGSSHGGGAPMQFGDTWEWDGESWTQSSAPGPPARIGAQLSYDVRRRRVVLFGGADLANRRNFSDTWEWDGGIWREVGSSGPAARFYHVMIYDEARGKSLLFGGNTAAGQLSLEKMKEGKRSDTWEWDGKKWSQVSSSGPSARDHHSMTYDSARRRAVLFGGFDGNYLGDTWEWDGKTWKQVASLGPPARGGKPGMAYVGALRKVLLFGGGIGGGTAARPQAFNDSWAWDGREWANVGGE